MHRALLRRVAAVLLLTQVAGCSLAQVAQQQEQGFEQGSCAPLSEPLATIYVANLGWHTGIILRSTDIGADLAAKIPEAERNDWIEIGWGDRDFYMSRGYSYWEGFRALFFSGGSTLHVAGLDQPPERFFRENFLARLQVSAEGRSRLIDFIGSELQLDEHGNSIRLGESLYGRGSFYAAASRFSVSRTCNTWAAEALARAGCPFDSDLIRASTLMRRLQAITQHRPLP